MEFAEIKDWLDKQIAWRNDGAALKKFNSQIEALDVPAEKRIHLWETELAADLLGVKMQREPYCEEYDCLYFMYEGYKVFCLKDKAYAG